MMDLIIMKAQLNQWAENFMIVFRRLWVVHCDGIKIGINTITSKQVHSIILNFFLTQMILHQTIRRIGRYK